MSILCVVLDCPNRLAVLIERPDSSGNGLYMIVLVSLIVMLSELLVPMIFRLVHPHIQFPLIFALAII